MNQAPSSPHDADNRKITIKDVARAAGVSISSVSRTLSNHPNVSAALRVRVERAVELLGYQPDFLAHSLRRGNTHSVGFLVGAISNPIMADLSASAGNVLAAESYAMLLVCSQNDPDADVAYLRFLAHRQVGGLIISSAANGPDQTAPLLAELALPTVMLDRHRPDLPHVSAVQSDHASGMKAAVKHLLAQGHRRIAMIGGLPFLYPAHNRLKGYRAALEDAGLNCDASLLRSVGFQADRAYTETLDLLTLPAPPTALIAAGNTTLIGVLEALRQRGARAGADLALIGCDDTALSRLHTPAITVIERDLALLGETAARLLLDAMQGSAGQTVHLPTKLVIRASSTFGVLEH